MHLANTFSMAQTRRNRSERGDRVKHKELLGKSLSQFNFNERTERAESRHSPTKPAKMWSMCVTCGGISPCRLRVYKGTFTKETNPCLVSLLTFQAFEVLIF